MIESVDATCSCRFARELRCFLLSRSENLRSCGIESITNSMLDLNGKKSRVSAEVWLQTISIANILEPLIVIHFFSVGSFICLQHMTCFISSASSSYL
jgi:hypothetical protein